MGTKPEIMLQDVWRCQVSSKTSNLKDGDVAYVTKYALDNGIVRVKVDYADRECVYVGYSIYTRGDNIFATVKDAQVRAKEMAQDRLAALRLEADKLVAIIDDGAKVVG